MVRCLLLTAAVLAVPVASASAQEDTSPPMQSFGQFVGLCGQTDDAVSMAFCHGYILGNGHLYLELRSAGAVQSWACANPVPTLEEIRVRIVEWGKAHPEHAAAKAVDGVWRAAAEIWPCS
jgi:hypothetical protein